VLVDAANVIPPWENMRQIAALSTDLICISGGKDIRGPQCSGVLAGRRDLIRAAWLNSSPHSDAQGRPMKVGREEMVGVWLAIERYTKLDFDAINRRWHQQTEYLLAELSKIPALKVSYAPYETLRHIPRLNVTWDEQVVGLTTQDCIKQLWDGEPRIAVRHEDGPGFEVGFFMGEPGDEELLARRLKEIFSAARRT
jgi:seryl-tRNA(Sec) selenium transferase